MQNYSVALGINTYYLYLGQGERAQIQIQRFLVQRLLPSLPQATTVPARKNIFP